VTLLVLVAATCAGVVAVLRPTPVSRALAAAAAIAAAIVCVPAAGLLAWCSGWVAALWVSPSVAQRPWLAAATHLAWTAAIAASDPVAGRPAAHAVASLFAGTCMLAAALRLASAAPAAAIGVVVAIAAPARPPGGGHPLALQLPEGLASVAVTAGAGVDAPVAVGWQWACAVCLVVGLAAGSGRLRWACAGCAAVCGAGVAARAAQGGLWPAVDVLLRMAAVVALWPIRWRGTRGWPTGDPSVLVRSAAIALGATVALWAAQFAPASGPALPHDPRGWALAASAVALLAATHRPHGGPGPAQGAVAAVLVGCAAALLGGSAAGWTVADVALAQPH